MDFRGDLQEDDKEQRSPKEVQRLENLVRDLGSNRQRVCITWLIFKPENTSGANYVFIVGSSVVEAIATLCRYESNDRT
jgi:hypothetical protein